MNEFYEVPVNKFFGYTVISRTSETAVISMEVRREFLQEEGIVQGGILSAIADTAAVYTFYPDLKGTEEITSIEFKVSFLRPATSDGGPLIAKAKVVHRGRRIGVCDVEVSQSDLMVLKGLFTYLFYDSEGRAVR